VVKNLMMKLGSSIGLIGPALIKFCYDGKNNTIAPLKPCGSKHRLWLI
jgi:hypothetical protein